MRVVLTDYSGTIVLAIALLFLFALYLSWTATRLDRLHLRLDRYSCFAASNAGERAGVDVFDAENLAIPCGWWVTQDERERIAATIREGW